MILDNTNLNNYTLLRHINSYIHSIMGLMNKAINIFETHNAAATIMITLLQTL